MFYLYFLFQEAENISKPTIENSAEPAFDFLWYLLILYSLYFDLFSTEVLKFLQYINLSFGCCCIQFGLVVSDENDLNAKMLLRHMIRPYLQNQLIDSRNIQSHFMVQ